MEEILSLIGHQLTVVSAFGDNIYVWTSVLIAFSLYLLLNKHAKAALLIILTTTSYVYSIILKAIFRFERPASAVIHNFTKLDLFAFPSSHVTFYTVFWGFLLYLTYKYVKEAKLGLHVIRVFAIYFITTVGISRVYVGAHYIRDVLGGYFFGGIFLAGMIFLDMKLDKVFNKNNSKNDKRSQSVN